MSDDRKGPTLLLIDLDPSLADSWRTAFAEWSADVEVRTAPIDSVLDEVDAVITAGNSYGEMSGGVDRALASALPGVQRAVWAHLADRHHGYQPVGTAEVVPTGHAICRWLVYAPTMRVPMPLTHGRDVAVHDAFWAALVAISRHNTSSEDGKIAAIACPGFGTGYGRVPPKRAAELMATAYRFWLASPGSRIAAREELLQG